MEESDRPFAPDAEPDQDGVWPAERDLEAVRGLVALWSSARDRVAPGLTDYQVEALEAVGRAREINQVGLAQVLAVRPSACSRLCGRLVAAGLLERRTHPGRRREVLLSVTSRGRRVVGEVTARRRAELRAVLERMPPRERAALVDGLRATARIAPVER